jgi:hypothetical protein
MDELFIVGAGGYFTVARTLLSANQPGQSSLRIEGTGNRRRRVANRIGQEIIEKQERLTK